MAAREVQVRVTLPLGTAVCMDVSTGERCRFVDWNLTTDPDRCLLFDRLLVNRGMLHVRCDECQTATGRP